MIQVLFTTCFSEVTIVYRSNRTLFFWSLLFDKKDDKFNILLNKCVISNCYPKREVKVITLSYHKNKTYSTGWRQELPRGVKQFTVEQWYNEPLYNEDPGLMNDIFQPSNSEMYQKEPRYSEPLL